MKIVNISRELRREACNTVGVRLYSEDAVWQRVLAPVRIRCTIWVRRVFLLFKTLQKGIRVGSLSRSKEHEVYLNGRKQVQYIRCYPWINAITGKTYANKK